MCRTHANTRPSVCQCAVSDNPRIRKAHFSLGHHDWALIASLPPPPPPHTHTIRSESTATEQSISRSIVNIAMWSSSSTLSQRTRRARLSDNAFSTAADVVRLSVRQRLLNGC